MRALTFPSSIAFYVGPWPVRWYGIVYGLGLMLSVLYSRWCIRKNYFPGLVQENIENFVNVASLGIVIGARLGHFLLYDRAALVCDPLDIFYVWEGGMSFHGGLIGLIMVLWLYTKKHRINALRFSDALACGVPIGLFLGRIGNFINQELYGHPTCQPWGVVFPLVDSQKRHPSQLYEAFLEGIMLFIILRILMVSYAKKWPPGRISACFSIFYGLFRCIGEMFRVPDDGLYKGITWGQWYSIPMIFVGVLFFIVPLGSKKSHV